MALLNKAAILAADDLPHEDVPVPAWGGSVRVRVMTGGERDEFYAIVGTHENGVVPPAKFAALMLALTCIDESGGRMFTVEDVEKLEAKSAGSVDIPASVAMRINRMGGAAVPEAVKNSKSDQSDDSGSGSQKSLAKA